MHSDELVKMLALIENALDSYEYEQDFRPMEAIIKNPAYAKTLLARFPQISRVEELLEKLPVLQGEEYHAFAYPYRRYISVFCKNRKRVHADYVQISYAYKGAHSVQVGNKAVHLLEGQTILMNAGVLHEYRADTPEDILVSFLLTEDYLNNILLIDFAEQEEEVFGNFFSTAFQQKFARQDMLLVDTRGNELIRTFFLSLVWEATVQLIYSSEMCRSLVIMIIVELVREYSGCRNTTNNTMLGQFKIQDIVHYIRDNCSSITLGAVAEKFYFSPNYLSGALKKATGLSYKDIVHKARMQKVCRMLQDTDMPVSEVAASMGYRNISFFYMLFQKFYGLTPAEYRKRQQEQNS